MTSAGISTSSYMNVNSGKEVTASSKTKDSSSDFTKILDAKTDSTKNSSISTGTESTSVKANDYKTDKNSLNDNKKISADDQKLNEDQDVKLDTMQEKIRKLFSNDSGKTDDSTAIENAMSTLSTQLVDFVNQVVDDLSEALGISKEEITDAIDSLNMTATDLLDKNNLNSLVMNLTGADNMMMALSNENLSDTMMNLFDEATTINDELQNVISEVAETVGENSEEVNEAINQLVNNINNDVKALIQSDKTVTSVDDSENIENSEVMISDISAEKSEENKNAEEFLENNDSRSESKSENTEKITQTVTQTNVVGNAYETIISNIETALDGSETTSSVTTRIISQVIDGITTSMNSDATTLELQLNPENLGKVNIAVTSRNGVLTASIMAQNEVTKEAIESQISTLKENFENQGLKVEEIEVTISSRSFDQNLNDSASSDDGKQQSKSGRHISKAELDEINGITESDELEVENVVEELGSKLSVQA